MNRTTLPVAAVFRVLALFMVTLCALPAVADEAPTPPPATSEAPAADAPLEELSPSVDAAPPLEELAPGTATSATRDSVPHPAQDEVTWPAHLLGAAAEGGVGAVVALAVNFALPVLVFGGLMLPVVLYARMTLAQDNNGWEGIIAVLVVVLGGLVSGAAALVSAPVGAALAFVLGVTGAAAVRAAARMATAGLRSADAVDLLVPVLGVAAAFPTLLLAGVIMGGAAALIPLTFFITNSISIAELPGWVFPGLLFAGAGLGLAALVLDMLLGLTVRTALYVGLRAGSAMAGEKLAGRE